MNTMDGPMNEWDIVSGWILGTLTSAEAEDLLFERGVNPKRVWVLLYGADAPFDE